MSNSDQKADGCLVKFIPEEPKSDKLVFNAVELLALGNIKPKYLLEPFLPQKGVGFLVGRPDTGKSQFARQLSIQVALGDDNFLGFKLNPIHKRSIYIATEDDLDGTKYLMSKQFDGLDKKVVENIRFMFGDIMEPDEIIKELNKQLKESCVDLVVVDSFGDIFMGKDSNNNMAMRNCVKMYDVIAKKNITASFYLSTILTKLVIVKHLGNIMFRGDQD